MKSVRFTGETCCYWLKIINVVFQQFKHQKLNPIHFHCSVVEADFYLLRFYKLCARINTPVWVRTCVFLCDVLCEWNNPTMNSRNCLNQDYSSSFYFLIRFPRRKCWKIVGNQQDSHTEIKDLLVLLSNEAYRPNSVLLMLFRSVIT